MRETVVLALEALRVLRVLPRIEWVRRRLGPRPAAEVARRHGRSRPWRSEAERASLKRAIRWIDGRFVGSSGNCYRRALIEMALDSGAAAERLMLGIRAHGAPSSGHAWLASEASPSGTYDVVFSV